MQGRTDGQCRLLLTFIGSGKGDGFCQVNNYRGKVVETARSVAVRIEPADPPKPTRGPNAGCTAEGYQRSAIAQLSRPLNGRKVVNEDGLAIFLADGAALLHPTSLPDGLKLGFEKGLEGPDLIWDITYRSAGRDLSLTVRQGDAALGRLRDSGRSFKPIVLGRPEVRGQRATLATFHGEEGSNHVLVWTEGGRGFSVQALGRIDPHHVVDVARSLR